MVATIRTFVHSSMWRRARMAAVPAVALACVSLAQADGLATLDHYLKNTRSGVASFTQTVTNADKPGAANPSCAPFAFNLPQQIRYDYQKTFLHCELFFPTKNRNLLFWQWYFFHYFADQ